MIVQLLGNRQGALQRLCGTRIVAAATVGHPDAKGRLLDADSVPDAFCDLPGELVTAQRLVEAAGARQSIALGGERAPQIDVEAVRIAIHGLGRLSIHADETHGKLAGRSGRRLSLQSLRA